MTGLNNLWKMGTKKASFETKSKKLEIYQLCQKSPILVVIPFSVKYSSALPNIREIINKHWHLLNINNTFQNISTQHPS